MLRGQPGGTFCGHLLPIFYGAIRGRCMRRGILGGPTDDPSFAFGSLCDAFSSVLTLGSFHLSLMAAIGIWLWLDPAKFGNLIHCDPKPTLAVVGASVDFSSTPLHIFSLTMYFLLLKPGFNLLPPFLFFLTLHVWYNWSRNRHAWLWDPCVDAFESILRLFRTKAPVEEVRVSTYHH